MNYVNAVKNKEMTIAEACMMIDRAITYLDMTYLEKEKKELLSMEEKELQILP